MTGLTYKFEVIGVIVAAIAFCSIAFQPKNETQTGGKRKTRRKLLQ